MAEDYGIIAAYLALGIQALLPIVLGSFKSLKVRLTALPIQPIYKSERDRTLRPPPRH